MSRFQTSIPVPLAELIAALPSKSFVHGATFDKETSSVVLNWECDRFESGMIVPVEFPSELLGKKKLPPKVRDITKPVVKAEPLPVVKAPEVEPPKVEPPKYLTDAEFAENRADNVPMEFQGITSQWQPVDAGHEFTQGYFYRVKA